MSTTDLLGDPLPDPLPQRQRLRDIKDLLGHTIKAVFSGNAMHSGSLVIVTDTLCWLVLEAEEDPDDGAYITTHQFGSNDIATYVNAHELMHAGCITPDEFNVIDEKQKRVAEEKKQRSIEFHRKKLAELEGGPAGPANGAA